MARANMNEMLRKRMCATQQASEQQTGDAAYEQIFQMPVPKTETQFRDVPIEKLRPFFTPSPPTSGSIPTPTPSWKPLRKN